MDGALLCIFGVPPRYVTAREMSLKYHGDVPKSIHFECPYCARPVIICADEGVTPRSRSSRRRGFRESRNPYFRHSKNDPLTLMCPDYHGGVANESEGLTPPVMMFLRRESGNRRTFRIEFGLRNRGRGLKQRLDQCGAEMLIDGVSRKIGELIGDRRMKIAVPCPTFRLSDRIRIPEQWQRSVGCIEDGNGVFVFSDAFGRNGGRRLKNGGALHAGFNYYMVVASHGVKAIKSVFDIAEDVGAIESGDSYLHVVKCRVLPQSERWDRADQWLTDRGFRLAESDIAATLMWPPSLRSAGVDEVLFRRSPVIYASLYAGLGDMFSDHVDMHSFASEHGFDRDSVHDVGFMRLGRRNNIINEMESYCLFVKPSRYLPWNSVIASMTYPSDLCLADSEMESLDLRPANDTHSGKDDVDEMMNDLVLDCLMRRNRSMDVALIRQGNRTRYNLSNSLLIARSREDV